MKDSNLDYFYPKCVCFARLVFLRAICWLALRKYCLEENEEFLFVHHRLLQNLDCI